MQGAQMCGFRILIQYMSLESSNPTRREDVLTRTEHVSNAVC